MSTKVALVTGAGSGIGRAVALALQNGGYDVDVSWPTGNGTEPYSRYGVGFRRQNAARDNRCDEAESVQELFREIEKSFCRLDVLFNNAGVGAPAIPLEDLTFEQWTTVVNVNLTGSFLCAQQAIRLMKAQRPSGGRIINNGSISAMFPRPNSAPYTATKHAINGLTKSISLDGRKYGIACSQIDIGNAATEMTEKMTGGILQTRGDVIVEPPAWTSVTWLMRSFTWPTYRWKRTSSL